MIVFALALVSWANTGWADNPRPVVAKASWASDPFARQVLPVALREEAKPEPPTPKPSEPTPKVPKPVAALPANEWRSFTANPAYEVLGRLDASGVFRYTATRLKTPAYAAPRYYAPVLQYGSPCANGSCPR